MKVGKLSLVAVALAMTVTASSLAAGEKIKVTSTNFWGQGTGGGPFEVEPAGTWSNLPEGLGLHGAAAGRFLTLCIETNETLGDNGEYFIQFSNEARAGGSGGPSPDPLDDRTRYLYTHFIRGTIGSQIAVWAGNGGLGGTFTYGEAASGAALQSAVWYIEDEGPGSNNFLAQLAAWAIANPLLADHSGMNKVKVMNLWDNADFTGNRQDLLVMIPLPAPVWMAGVGLVGVVGFVYRRRRAGRDSDAVECLG